MALSIIPKSEMRQVTSITQGYGEIPTVEKNGQLGFALPGNQITFDRQIAEHFLNTLDNTIRSNILPKPVPKPKPVSRVRVNVTPEATIIYGQGIIPLVKRNGQNCWLLPGQQTTRVHAVALKAAKQLDALISFNTRKQLRN